MARASKERVRVEEAARAVLIEGERITSTGRCWAVQTRGKVPLLFLARRKYLMALTDRRVLVFAHRRGGPHGSDLIIGKRYETFRLERVKRRRPLVQVSLLASTGNRLVFEFRRRQRELAGELIARLTPGPRSLLADDATTEDTPTTESNLTPSWSSEAPDEDAPEAEASDGSVFWGSR